MSSFSSNAPFLFYRIHWTKLSTEMYDRLHHYGAVSVSVFVFFFYPGHYLSHLPQLEPWQMDRSSCRAWRLASTQAKTGTGMAGEAAAPTTAATGVPGVVVGQQPGCNRCRGNCLATLYPRHLPEHYLGHISGSSWNQTLRGTVLGSN